MENAKMSRGFTKTIAGGKPGPGRPGDGKHFTGTPKGTGQHPKHATGAKSGQVAVAASMDPGTQVPHGAALSNNFLPQSPTPPNNNFIRRRGRGKQK
jgi:hypothetical protein